MTDVFFLFHFFTFCAALSLERERELTDSGKVDDSKLPQSFKNNYFKPNGARTNYLGGQQVSAPARCTQGNTTPTRKHTPELRSKAGPLPVLYDMGMTASCIMAENNAEGLGTLLNKNYFYALLSFACVNFTF